MTDHGSPLGYDALAALLDRHGVNEEGRKLIEQIRRGPPVRAVQGGGGNVTGIYPSRKMGCFVQYESNGPEFAFVIVCETDRRVREYHDQPCRLVLEYEVQAKKGPRKVSVSHTPDFSVLYDDRRPTFFECKSRDQLEKLVQEPNSRYVADGDGFRCPPGEAASAYYGFRLRGVDPRVRCRPTLTDNSRFLEAEWGEVGAYVRRPSHRQHHRASPCGSGDLT